MVNRIRFDEIKTVAPSESGIYEIHMNSGIALKIGIGVNLKKRLLNHYCSYQSCLRLKYQGNWNQPNDVKSKGSILAKHLYYDHSLAPEYDLTTQQGRRTFLSDQCYIIFETTLTREEARKLELSREKPSAFRYVGDVTIK